MSLGTKPQVKGVPEKFYSQLAASHLTPPVTSVIVGDRQRELDEKTVCELYESIEVTGLQAPIGIREKLVNGKRERHLIFGLHRFAAWSRKYEEALKAQDEDGMARWHTIPALVYPEAMTDEMALLLEVQENLDRKELSDAERKSGMGRKAQLLKRMNGEEGTKNAGGTKGTTWYPPKRSDQAAKLGMPDRTLQKWYTAYKADHHGKAWNKQTEKEYDAFLQWLADAEKRAKEAEEEAAADAQAKVYTDALADVQKRMAQLVTDYGAPARKDLQEYAHGL